MSATLFRTSDKSRQMQRAQTEMPASRYIGAKLKLLSSVMERSDLPITISKFYVLVTSSDGIVASCNVKIQQSRLKLYRICIYSFSKKVLDLPLAALKMRFKEESLTVSFNHAAAKWRTVPDTRLKFENYLHFIVFLRQYYAAFEHSAQ